MIRSLIHPYTERTEADVAGAQMTVANDFIGLQSDCADWPKEPLRGSSILET